MLLLSTILVKDSVCCGYGNNGIGTGGFDCAIIVGASKTGGTSLPGSEFCGRMGLATANNAAANTVCSESIFFLCVPFVPSSSRLSFNFSDIMYAAMTQPFNVRFLSDLYEAQAEVANNNVDQGFRLAYIQTSC